MQECLKIARGLCKACSACGLDCEYYETANTFGVLEKDCYGFRVRVKYGTKWVSYEFHTEDGAVRFMRNCCITLLNEGDCQ